uniref:Uncharacterized protein n=1 Tax=Arundo donax TaxID=35708 RepID=A0A0A9C7B3_ARUDO
MPSRRWRRTRGWEDAATVMAASMASKMLSPAPRKNPSQ